jgi:hypothetical protein
VAAAIPFGQVLGGVHPHGHDGIDVVRRRNVNNDARSLRPGGGHSGNLVARVLAGDEATFRANPIGQDR